MSDSLCVEIEGGFLQATVSSGPENPGIVIEFIANEEVDKDLFRPTIMMEKPEFGDLRVLVWANKDDEDYPQEIVFE